MEDGPPPEVFSKYVCHSLDFGREHPGEVAEPAGLALVPLPAPEFPIRDSLPPGVVEEGKLSCLQLEGVLYACQVSLSYLTLRNNQMILESQLPHTTRQLIILIGDSKITIS